MNELFIEAVKGKYRFPYKGQITLEDLYDLNVKELDRIYGTLNDEVEDNSSKSLLNTKSARNKELENKIAIVKYVFETKQQEAANRLLEKEKKEKHQRIMDIIADKEDEALKNMSVEQLKAMME